MTTNTTNTKREKLLLKKGFSRPLDDSPVDVPDGWHGGMVESTGGGLYLRRWETYPGEERQNATEYEVVYGSGNNNGVALQQLSWEDKYEGYIHNETILVREPDYESDYLRAGIARELMIGLNRYLDDVVSPEVTVTFSSSTYDIYPVTVNGVGEQLYTEKFGEVPPADSIERINYVAFVTAIETTNAIEEARSIVASAPAFDSVDVDRLDQDDITATVEHRLTTDE